MKAQAVGQQVMVHQHRGAQNHMARIMGDEFSGAFDTLTERERG